MAVAAFTICTNSYLAQAGVLLASLRVHAPDWRLYLGLVDEPSPTLLAELPAEVTILPAAELRSSRVDELAARYNIVELCTALKPAVARTILESDATLEQIHYLDPDICFFNSATPLVEALTAAPVTLTPHHLLPIPLDGAFPAENLALNHGVFNLGYLGLRRGPTVEALLDWWEKRMQEDCRIDLREGYFVDQLWFNLMPIYFPETAMVRLPGANVAFWNLHERTLRSGHQIEFRGARHPLMFFHFSGFSPSHPDRITRRTVRHDAGNNPALAQLLTEYARDVMARRYLERRGLESSYALRRRAVCEEQQRAEQRRHPWRWLVRTARARVPEPVKRLFR